MSIKIATPDKTTPMMAARLLSQLLNNSSTLIRRSELMSRMGKDTYNGDRDIYQALGYPRTITTEDYYNRYYRQDIAKRINNIMADECWKKHPTIIDRGDAANISQFEQAIQQLTKQLNVYSIFKRLDRIVGFGRYAVLFLGFNDAKQENDLRSQVEGANKLLYVQPYSEASAGIVEWVQSVNDPRFREPEVYEINTVGDSAKDSATFQVHYSRIIHVVEDPLESPIYGSPRLELIYNRLIDIERIAGGSGEMFWRGARPGYAAVINEDATVTAQDKEDMQDEFDEYEHNLRRILRLVGVDMQPLQVQVADPNPHLKAQFQLISIAFGIPMRILMGSERGELASTQDENAWKEKVQDRINNYCTPAIVRPFIDRLIEYGAVPEPEGGDYEVTWPSLWGINKKEQATIARDVSAAIKSYTDAMGAESIVPLEMYLSDVLGWDEEKVKQAVDMIEGQLQEQGII